MDEGRGSNVPQFPLDPGTLLVVIPDPVLYLTDTNLSNNYV